MGSFWLVEALTRAGQTDPARSGQLMHPHATAHRTTTIFPPA
jgi:hypothetical protein